MTRRPPDLCTSCRESLPEARIVVHDASGDLTGQFHVSNCLQDWALLVETEKNRNKFVNH